MRTLSAGGTSFRQRISTSPSGDMSRRPSCSTSRHGLAVRPRFLRGRRGLGVLQTAGRNLRHAERLDVPRSNAPGVHRAAGRTFFVQRISSSAAQCSRHPMCGRSCRPSFHGSGRPHAAHLDIRRGDALGFRLAGALDVHHAAGLSVFIFADASTCNKQRFSTPHPFLWMRLEYSSHSSTCPMRRVSTSVMQPLKTLLMLLPSTFL